MSDDDREVVIPLQTALTPEQDARAIACERAARLLRMHHPLGVAGQVDAAQVLQVAEWIVGGEPA